jgi:hypothetical protein
MERIDSLEQEVNLLKERNARVEAEKAWETSWARILWISGITYFVGLVVLSMIGVRDPVFAACMPAIGFILSTLSLPKLKKRWLENK